MSFGFEIYTASGQKKVSTSDRITTLISEVVINAAHATPYNISIPSDVSNFSNWFVFAYQFNSNTSQYFGVDYSVIRNVRAESTYITIQTNNFDYNGRAYIYFVGI